jgi:hypothetical protein
LGGRGHIGIAGISGATQSIGNRNNSMGTIDRNIDVTSSMYKPYDTMLMRKRRVSLLNQPSTSGESRMELADPTAAVTKFMPEKKGK